MAEDQSLKRFHDYRSQDGRCSHLILLYSGGFRGDQDENEVFEARENLKHLQRYVKDVSEDRGHFVSAGSQLGGQHIVRFWRFSDLQMLMEPIHILVRMQSDKSFLYQCSLFTAVKE